MQKIEAHHQKIKSYTLHSNCIDHYSSVEISQAHTFCYHFKLWRIDTANPCILVKEDSQILPGLKEGDRLHMRYYGGEALSDTELRETAIQSIRKADDGRFKGHYLVYLDILN